MKKEKKTKTPLPKQVSKVKKASKKKSDEKRRKDAQFIMKMMGWSD